MRLDAYTETLRRTLVEISSLGDERTQEVAHSLTAALDPALRLVTLQMLADTVDELNGELDGVHVAVVMDGSTPHLLVNQATPLNQDAEAVGVPVQNTSQVSQEPMAQEGNEVRTTLEAARSALAGHESPSGSWSSAGTWTAGTGTAHGASEFDGAGNRSGRPTGPTGRQTSGVTLTGWFG